MYKVVGFYTYDTPYEQESRQFVENIGSFGLDVEVHGYANRGEWVQNAAIKPSFILKTLEQNDCDILYLDVDARIRQVPNLFENFEGDVGVHYRKGRELLSGTIYLKNTLAVRAMVADWARQQAKQPRVWDQRVLQQVLPKHQLQVVDLPASYTQIFDTMAHHGPPVIEHLQASRRYKKQVTGDVNIPHVIGNMRIRRGGDGSYLIVRRHREAEAFLDEHCIRARPRALKWYPKISSECKIDTLREVFEGKRVNIIGKGPSLDHLRAEHFPNPDEPIIGLNEAAHVVAKLGLPNPQFGLQQDARLRNTCKPKGVPHFVSVKAANYYADLEDIYVFNAQRYDLTINALSVTAAIKICRSLGVHHFRFVCFDSCVNQKLEYAKAIPYTVTWGGSPKRFLSHRAKILKHASKCRVEWVIPEARASEASGRPRR